MIDDGASLGRLVVLTKDGQDGPMFYVKEDMIIGRYVHEWIFVIKSNG